MALRVALKCPQRVACLVLASPAGAPVSASQLAALKDSFRLATHQAGIDFMSKVTAYPEKISGPLLHLMAWACRARVSTPSIRAILTTASSSHMLSAKELAGLRPPSLLIWGKHEKILPREGLEFFRRNLPRGVEINETENFGHGAYQPMSAFSHEPLLFPRGAVECLSSDISSTCLSVYLAGSAILG